MIKIEDIQRNFIDIVEFQNGALKFKDIVPAYSYIYYFINDKTNSRNVLAVSQDSEDDILAKLLLKAGCEAPNNISDLCKYAFCQGKEIGYPFTHCIMAPPQYHSYFKGRLDIERTDLFLVIPIFKCEFSGDESIELFYQLRREVVSTLDWKRTPNPKVMVRFDNPATGGGTTGKFPVPIRYNVLQEEICNLDGVMSGFIEVTSYRGDYAELLSPKLGTYSIRLQDQPCAKILNYSEVLDDLWLFLTE